MPVSTSFFKTETLDYIVKNFKTDIKILDVGPGVGTYSNLLKPLGYTNLDCVEVFSKYIDDYQLKGKYNRVYNENIVETNIDFNTYDLIIFGDVLEHTSEEDSIKLLSKIDDSKTNVIIAVPFMASQGEHCGNTHEIHVQDKLTYRKFLDTYKNYTAFCVRYDYGVFLNKNDLNNDQIIYTIDLPDEAEIKKDYPHKAIINLNNVAEKVEQKKQDVENNFPMTTDSSLTLVTGLWNLGRGDIGTSFHRSYQTYLDKFIELLKAPVNLYIFIDKADEELVWKHRSRTNTVVNTMSLQELEKWFPFTSLTDTIRKKPEWLGQAGWLAESTQAKLKMYNPLVMSKMFMLNNVSIWNPFNSKQFYWIDAGITNTVHWGYFTHDKVQEKLSKIVDKFMFISFPYPEGGEIHGFTRTKMNELAQTKNVEYVCRGGFFGGPKDTISQANGMYYGLLQQTLNEGYMGTEESIFTLMTYLNRDLFSLFSIDGNGLIGKFFEDLKNTKVEDAAKLKVKEYAGTSLYVITFNSPKQFETLCESYTKHPGFISETTNYLLDNSTDLSTTEEYKRICKQYNFEHIKKDNLGICGGRQFIAEHFDKTDAKQYIFLEDDMYLLEENGDRCKSGFARYLPNLFSKIHKIMDKEGLDFLKFSFTEFYGNNSTQWSWYNVPQNIREKFWPNYCKLPEIGTDPKSPKTEFKNIKILEGLAYATGDIYYCNWPQIVSREGNKKMFLTTTWAHPFEQTWMSYIFQLTKEGTINSAVLLLSPIEHNRFAHYKSELRKES
jgi:hypothetical protein